MQFTADLSVQQGRHWPPPVRPRGLCHGAGEGGEEGEGDTAAGEEAPNWSWAEPVPYCYRAVGPDPEAAVCGTSIGMEAKGEGRFSQPYACSLPAASRLA